MSQDEQLDELDNATDASSDTNSEAGTNDIGEDDIDSPMTESSLPKEGDPDYEPDEVVAPKEVQVGDAEKAKAKVQLDIEDAPFLEDDEEEEEEEAAAASTGGGGGGGGGSVPGKPAEEGDEGKKKKLTKKKIIILAVLAFLLVTIIVLVAVLLLGSGDGDADGKGAGTAGTEVLRDADGNVIVNPDLEPFIVVVEPFVEPTGPPVFSLDLEPFWVEIRDPEGKTFFLVSNFTLVVEEEKNLVNLNAQLASIRDAIYYHLATQEYELLTDTKNLPALRKSLSDRVNELLSGIKLKDLLYTSYTVR